MLFFILHVITYFRQQWAKFYEYCLKNSAIVYFLQIVIYNISKCIYSYKIAPPYNYWSLCYLENMSGITELIYTTEIPTTDHLSILLNIKPNALFFCQYNALIHCFVNPPKSLSVEKTPRQFLSILYSHPKMKNTIHIDLDTGIFLVGNEILSAAFVERYLSYQSQPYIFDANYKLEIMNKKLQMFDLTCSQYIVLTKNGYEIV